MDGPLVLESFVPMVSPSAALVGAAGIPYETLGLLRAVAMGGARTASAPEWLAATGGTGADANLEHSAIIASLGGGVLLLGGRGGAAQLLTADALADLVLTLERLRQDIERDDLPSGSAAVRWARGELGYEAARRSPLAEPLWRVLAPGAALHAAVATLGELCGASWRDGLAALETELPAEALAASAEALSRLGVEAAGEAVRVARAVLAADASAAPGASRAAAAAAGPGAVRARRALALGLAARAEAGREDAAPALAALEAAAELDPEDMALKAALLRASLRAGGEDRLLEACRLGGELWLAGEAGLAGDGLERAWAALAAMRPPDAERLAALRAAWKAGDHSRTATLGTALLDGPCWSAEVHVRTALARVFDGRIDEAIGGLERYVAARPDDARGWENLVAARVTAGRRRADPSIAAQETAVGTARVAVRLHPHVVPILLNAVEAHLDAGLFQEALELARQAASRAQGDPRVSAVVERSLALVADRPSRGVDPAADYNIGAARLNAGDVGGSVPFLAAAFSHAPEHPHAGEALGLAYLRAGDPRQAIAVLEEFVKRRPSEAHACGLLGLARLALYAPEPPALVTRRARRELERALGRMPNVAEFRVALARCLELEGNLAEARAELERAVALGDAGARARLELLGAPERG